MIEQFLKRIHKILTIHNREIMKTQSDKILKKFVGFVLIMFCTTYFGFTQVQIGGNIIPTINADGTGNYISISANGNRVVFGSQYADINGLNNVGAARVYENNNGSWSLLGQILEGSNEDQRFGYSVAIAPDGNRIAIGSHENVRVYEFDGNAWQQLGQDLVVPEISTAKELYFSADGNILAVAFGVTPTGQTYNQVYTLNGNNWETMGDEFTSPAGRNISISGTGTRIAMSYYSNGYQVRVYDFVNGSWQEVGNPIIAEFDHDVNELILSAEGNRVNIITENFTQVGADGHLLTYDFSNGSWTSTISALELYVEKMDRISMTSSGNGAVVAIGTSADLISDTRYVKVYKTLGTDWQQVGSEIPNWMHDEQNPHIVSMSADGTKLAIGSFLSEPGMSEGTIKVFDYSVVLPVREVQSSNDFNLSPNPTSGRFNIEMHENFSEVSVSITNIIGQVIAQERFENNEAITFNIQGNIGVYFVNIKNMDGAILTKRIFKQ